MYRKDNARQLTFENFYLPFGGKLRSGNRWVVLAKQIPWSVIEAEYAGQFSDHPAGRSARSVRVALGSLIIKERLGVSDRETARQIAENPYLQYFLGFAEYKDQEPFDPSLMTYFRQRFDAKILSRINDLIVKQGLSREQASKEPSSASPENDDQDSDPTPPANGGKLIVDATCAPADVAYPTDLNLLNDGRKKTEAIIDTLHMHRPGRKKPRTYRQTARRDYLAVAKQRKRGVQKNPQGDRGPDSVSSTKSASYRCDGLGRSACPFESASVSKSAGDPRTLPPAAGDVRSPSPQNRRPDHQHRPASPAADRSREGEKSGGIRRENIGKLGGGL